MPVIGFLGSTTSTERPEWLRAFRRGLGETGLAEGQNVAIQYRWAEGHYDRFPELARDLVRHRVAVIAAPGNIPVARAATSATTNIPIVFSIPDDPVKLGLVANLNWHCDAGQGGARCSQAMKPAAFCLVGFHALLRVLPQRVRHPVNKGVLLSLCQQRTCLNVIQFGYGTEGAITL